jgi:hypothetical protein
MIITRATIHSIGSRVFFQPHGNGGAMNMDIPVSEFNYAIDNNLVELLKDDIWVFTPKGRTLLQQLKNRQQELVAQGGRRI